MILHVIEASVCGPTLLRLAFNDGTRKTVDTIPLLHGPVFEPLRDPAYFARAVLDPICGTVVWPNGADFAPEALHDLAAVEESIPASLERLSPEVNQLTDDELFRELERRRAEVEQGAVKPVPWSDLRLEG